MSRKKILNIILVILGCLIICLFGNSLENTNSVVILDSKDQKFAKITYDNGDLVYTCDDRNWSYIDSVCHEALDILGETTSNKNLKKMFIKKYKVIHTYFNDEIVNSIENSYKNSEVIMANSFAAVFADVYGHMLACYSQSNDQSEKNFVEVPTYAGSTIKPLSVYGPAIEENMISWSSIYKDKVYKEIIDEYGNKVGWPKNEKSFPNGLGTVADALCVSNNVVAVKILKEFGVDKSMKFLKEKFHINLDKEEDLLQKYGEDSVLDNVGLGYLENGVNVKNMAGYYQVFANGGLYSPIHAISKIENEHGKTVYEEENKETRVFSKETSYVMNRLLRKVVLDNKIDKNKEGDIEICGKTGTSENYKDNWFIGTTPEYVGAVWFDGRGGFINENQSTNIFVDIINHLNCNFSKKYPYTENVRELDYCVDTGLLASSNCKKLKKGYYKVNNIPKKCTCK